MPAPAIPGALLDRYALVTKARGARSGERSAREAGHSVEFLDYRPYQPGDEPRAVDWRAYARSKRLYTRLYHAERAAELHVLLDTSPSMRLHGKRRFAAAAARLLVGLARHEALGQVHLLDGRSSRPARSRAELAALWRFVDEAPELPADPDVPLADALAARVLSLPTHPGAAALVVLSDLLDPAPLQSALTAARARRTDLVFVQTLASAELEPEPGRLELVDVEDGSVTEVGPEEARAYREAVRAFLARTRAEIAAAGQRHVLLLVPAPAEAARTGEAELERAVFAGLLRARVIARR